MNQTFGHKFMDTINVQKASANAPQTWSGGNNCPNNAVRATSKALNDKDQPMKDDHGQSLKSFNIKVKFLTRP